MAYSSQAVSNREKLVNILPFKHFVLLKFEDYKGGNSKYNKFESKVGGSQDKVGHPVVILYHLGVILSHPDIILSWGHIGSKG